MHDRYNTEDLDDVQKLQEEHQQIAKFLQVAEQEGIIDVYLAMVTDVDYCQCGFPPHVEVNDGDTTVDHWRGLDGSNPGWKELSLTEGSAADSDCILQVGFVAKQCTVSADVLSLSNVDHPERSVQGIVSMQNQLFNGKFKVSYASKCSCID